MGVSGAALATIIAQACEWFWYYDLCFHQTKRSYYQHDNTAILIKTLSKRLKIIHLLTCIQQSVMNFGILMIQGLVNSFGVITMSAFAAAVKIDSFAYMPVQDFGNAFSTFIAQNQGAIYQQRIHKGLKIRYPDFWYFLYFHFFNCLYFCTYTHADFHSS